MIQLTDLWGVYDKSEIAEELEIGTKIDVVAKDEIARNMTYLGISECDECEFNVEEEDCPGFMELIRQSEIDDGKYPASTYFCGVIEETNYGRRCRVTIRAAKEAKFKLITNYII